LDQTIIGYNSKKITAISKEKSKEKPLSPSLPDNNLRDNFSLNP
jgi:hypothetical protein